MLVDQILGSAQKKAAGAHPCAYRARADRNGEIDSALKKALGIATHPMEPSLEDSMRLVKNSTLYKEFLAERKEILCHRLEFVLARSWEVLPERKWRRLRKRVGIG